MSSDNVTFRQSLASSECTLCFYCWVRRFMRIKKELGYGIFCQNHEIFFDDNNAEIK